MQKENRQSYCRAYNWLQKLVESSSEISACKSFSEMRNNGNFKDFSYDKAWPKQVH